MEIKTEIVAGVAIIKLSGGLFGLRDDLSATLSAIVNQLLDEGHREIILNLERVSFVDGAGLGVIVQAHVAVKDRGGVLKLEGLHQRLQDEFGRARALTKLGQSFEASGYPFLDPFNPDLRAAARKSAVAAGGLLLLVIVAIITWIWGGSLGGR